MILQKSAYVPQNFSQEVTLVELKWDHSLQKRVAHNFSSCFCVWSFMIKNQADLLWTCCMIITRNFDVIRVLASEFLNYFAKLRSMTSSYHRWARYICYLDGFLLRFCEFFILREVMITLFCKLAHLHIWCEL